MLPRLIPGLPLCLREDGEINETRVNQEVGVWVMGFLWFIRLQHKFVCQTAGTFGPTTLEYFFLLGGGGEPKYQIVDFLLCHRLP
jgi:hypothetical protein